MISLLFALCLSSSVLAKPLVSRRWDAFEVKHAWQDVPAGWKLHDAAPSDHVLNLRIALKQDKFNELVTTLYEVSDPYHERQVHTAVFLVTLSRELSNSSIAFPRCDVEPQ